jgi:hypothetical protein
MGMFAPRRFVILGLVCAGAAFGSQYLIVRHAANGAWSFHPADSVLVNGKEKLRGVSLASQGLPAAWDSKTIGHQAEVRLADFSVVRPQADGSLLGRSGSEWKLLLPENLKAKAAEPAVQLWKASSIEFRQDRKDKAGTGLRLEEIYAIVPGADPGIAAAALATDISWHALPGVAEGEAFQRMVVLLPPVAKNFASGAPAETLRSYLSAGMSARLRTWQEGDADVAILGEANSLADAAQASFPSDAGLNALRAEVQTRRQWLTRKVAILRALDACKQADAFLVAYRDFEPFDRSFAALSQARVAHLNASAAAHFETARELQNRGDYAGAIRHLLIAKWRNPKLGGVDDLLEQARLEAARISAQRLAAARGAIDPRSPARVQLQRKLLMVEQYINDHKQEDAEKALAEAEAMDSAEPRLALLQAQLAISRGEFGRALALLDNYAGNAPTPQDLAEGEKLRASVLYSIDKERSKTGGDLASAFDEQRYSAALGTAADGLKIDNESPQFLFQAGVNTCILRNCDRAVPLLHRYLDVTDSTQGDRRQRIMAIRLLGEAEAAQRAAQAPAAKSPEAAVLSWLSGTPLGRGVFYDPASLAFQPKVARVDASERVSVAYEWNGNQLRSVHTRYEEKKTAGNIARLALAGAAASQGIGSTVGWRTPDRETNDFYFNYYDDVPQVLKVSRDNAVVKSRRISDLDSGHRRIRRSRHAGRPGRRDGHRDAQRPEGAGRYARDGGHAKYGRDGDAGRPAHRSTPHGRRRHFRATGDLRRGHRRIQLLRRGPPVHSIAAVFHPSGPAGRLVGRIPDAVEQSPAGYAPGLENHREARRGGILRQPFLPPVRLGRDPPFRTRLRRSGPRGACLGAG